MRKAISIGAVAALVALSGCRTQGPMTSRVAPSPLSQPAQVFVDLTILEVPGGREAPLRLDDPEAGTGPRVLTAAAVDALWKEVQRSPALSAIAAPKFLAISGQDASAFVVEEESGMPQAWRGLKAWATPSVDPDGQALSLSLRVLNRPSEGGEAVVEVAAARLRSGESLLIVGSSASAGGPRLVVLVSATVLRPAL